MQPEKSLNYRDYQHYSFEQMRELAKSLNSKQLADWSALATHDCFTEQDDSYGHCANDGCDHCYCTMALAIIGHEQNSRKGESNTSR